MNNKNNNHISLSKKIFSVKNQSYTTIIKTITFKGWEIILTEIEISITPGIPIISIVGLPNKTVNESKERIRCVLNYLGIGLPLGRIIINLSPADLIKEGTHYDLGILCGLLVHMKVLNIENIDEYVFFGELQLNGDILSTYGILPVGIFTYKNNLKLISSSKNKDTLAGLTEYGHGIFLFYNVMDLISYFEHKNLDKVVKISNYIPLQQETIVNDMYFSLSLITKRLMEIALTGYHNIILIGPPGGGKTTLSKILPQLLPDLTREESLEISSIYSMCGLLENQLITRPPFRAPHASSSIFGLLGGGSKPKPGEVSLAHKGILFLDEVNHFPSFVLDGLRECLTEDIISVSRVNYQITYPAEIQLIAAMNPCKCGFLGSRYQVCTCTSHTREKYKNKISGPFLDRIHMKLFLEESPTNEIINQKNWIIATKQKIATAKELIKNLYKRNCFDYKISRIPFHILDQNTKFSHTAKTFLKKYINDKNISIRNYHNIVRLSVTIQILDNREMIEEDIIAEAIFFSRQD